MKYKIKQEKGISMISLVITIIILVILTNVLIFNAQSNIEIHSLTNLYNDIQLLREKVSAYYNEYGKIPAEIKYTNISGLSSVLSTNNDSGDFYVIDLEAMQGITLNYGKDYNNIKNDQSNANNYTDVYVINDSSHNIFYVKGINIEQDNTTKTYYTDYTQPDETTIDLRYIDGILIPDSYYYIGKYTDNSGNESIVISKNKDGQINTTGENQYIWQKQISNLEKVPDSVELSEEQNENEFLKSVNLYKGYFKNKNKTTNIDVIYLSIAENKWSETYTKECEYEDENGDTAYIPKGFKVSMSPTMNTVASGLVAKDENENEWVWIEVPKSIFANPTYTSSNNNNDVTSKTDYTGIYNILDAYANDYRNGDITQSYEWKDEWYAVNGDTLVTASTSGLTEEQKELNNGCGLTYNEYEIKYKDMLSSVYTNGGFWISRYEIGDNTATENNTTRTSDSGTTGTAASKKDQIPYNFVTCKEAQILANGMIDNSSNKTSSLLFGIQWDLVCKFLEGKNGLTEEDINSDSTSWGNYKNSSITLSRGKYNINASNSSSIWTLFSVDTTNYVTSSKTSSNISYYQLLTTGASEDTNKMNIYDFAGNEAEWTLELTSEQNSPCSRRGGSCGGDGSKYSAANRGYDIASSSEENRERIGFRVSIY